METVSSLASLWMWVAFTGLIVGLLALDLLVFHKKAHEVHFREALVWSIVWVLLALGFNVVVWVAWGPEKGLEFLTGYLIEKSLSVDNLFVFLVIFAYFGVPPALQHRVLFWGILGALIMRALFIVAGAALLQAFDWVLYVFGAFLVFTGIKLLFQKDENVHPERNLALRLFRSVFPVVPEYRGDRFFVREGEASGGAEGRAGRLYATPLALVLVVVEATDVVFAVDSIPAIFAVTRDTFIVYTSNVFAILGLRALFFLLAGTLRRFVYLRHGLAVILAFIGVKMLVSECCHIPIAVSLAVVSAILAVAVAASLLKTRGGPTTP